MPIFAPEKSLRTANLYFAQYMLYLVNPDGAASFLGDSGRVLYGLPSSSWIAKLAGNEDETFSLGPILGMVGNGGNKRRYSGAHDYHGSK